MIIKYMKINKFLFCCLFVMSSCCSLKRIDNNSGSKQKIVYKNCKVITKLDYLQHNDYYSEISFSIKKRKGLKEKIYFNPNCILGVDANENYVFQVGPSLNFLELIDSIKIIELERNFVFSCKESINFDFDQIKLMFSYILEEDYENYKSRVEKLRGHTGGYEDIISSSEVFVIGTILHQNTETTKDKKYIIKYLDYDENVKSKIYCK